MRGVLRILALQAVLAIANAASSTSSLLAPTVTPTIENPNAPNPQQKCPGYKASNVANSNQGFTADLNLAGDPCNVFGTDIQDLVLEVTYQAKERLNVKITPKYIAPYNSSWYILDDNFVEQPKWDGSTSSHDSDLQIKWSNSPSFQFSISRQNGDDEIFSTFGSVLVFEDQFVEVKTSMVQDYNIYGISENIHNFRLGNDYNQTIWNADTADRLNGNSYGTHPFYQETRYSGNKSTAHGVYSRNVHGQDWLLQEDSLTLRTLGGSIDLYFLSGEAQSDNGGTWGGRPGWGHFWWGPGGGRQAPSSTAVEVFRQYQSGCVGLPTMQMYWTFGFHQCHWGIKDVQEMREIVLNYSAVNVPLEAIWTDIDAYDRTRVFTNDPVNFAPAAMQALHAWLRARDQYYVPLVDSNIYYPDPNNASDIYEPFIRGNELQTFIRSSGTGYYYLGNGWPGFSVWADWLLSSSQEWMTYEMNLANQRAPYDGIWNDLNEAASFCAYSCGNSEIPKNWIEPSKDVLANDPRDLVTPPYLINATQQPSNNFIDMVILPNATHNDEYNTTEYDIHNLFSAGIMRAAYNAMSETVFPGKRPFIIGRSSGPGTGRYAGNWGGDNASRWGALFLSISQVFTFQMVGIPMFGTDTCGFNTPNATEELCARWFELNAFFPFYRNHFTKGKAPQYAYTWPAVAESARRVITIRYSILTYIYTLFYYAHTQGDTVFRALAWEFPNDASLASTDNQFLLGPSILVTPVLTEGATSVQGVFPGIGQGTRWYDWYTLQEVTGVSPGENVTLAAPLEHINVHIRGGTVLTTQAPGNTTKITRANPYAIIITPDDHGTASGSLYLDDGESIVQQATKLVELEFANNRLTTNITGDYEATSPLANITVAGLQRQPRGASFQVEGGRAGNVTTSFSNNTLYVTGLEDYTQGGAWQKTFTLQVY